MGCLRTSQHPIPGFPAPAVLETGRWTSPAGTTGESYLTLPRFTAWRCREFQTPSPRGLQDVLRYKLLQHSSWWSTISHSSKDRRHSIVSYKCQISRQLLSCATEDVQSYAFERCQKIIGSNRTSCLDQQPTTNQLMHHWAVSCSNHFNTIAAINWVKNIFNDAYDSLLGKPEVFILPQNTSVLRHKKVSRRRSLCSSRNFGRMCGFCA